MEQSKEVLMKMRRIAELTDMERAEMSSDTLGSHLYEEDKSETLS